MKFGEIQSEEDGMGYDTERRESRCLECGDMIEYGRQDRKFCCTSCKNRFNNRRTRGSKAVKARILNALEKNYAILERLLKLGMTSLSAAQLRQLGFNFDYVTSYHKVRRHDEFCCFDISVTVMASRVISIERMKTP